MRGQAVICLALNIVLNNGKLKRIPENSCKLTSGLRNYLSITLWSSIFERSGWDLNDEISVGPYPSTSLRMTKRGSLGRHTPCYGAGPSLK